MALTKKDSVLVPWSTNFDTRITATPTTFGLTAAQATDYTPLHDAYITAWEAANNPGSRTKAAVAIKEAAKASLLAYARVLYAMVQVNPDVEDGDKELLGVLVKKTTRTTIPAPSETPSIDVKSVSGRTVSLRIHGVDSTKRKKPNGSTLVQVYSYVGETPPSDPALWRFEGCTSQFSLEVAFSPTVEAGSQVWFVSQFTNAKGQTGPASDAIGTTLAGGSAAPMVMKIAA